MAQHKERADELVYAQGLAESREQAKRLIMAGQIALASEEQATSPAVLTKVAKPGHGYRPDTRFVLIQKERFVSRGAYKLLTALEQFHLDVRGKVCLDAGASTGGFTDCLLQYGAERVYAVDVGKDQLHERLKADDRVISREGVNLRLAPPDFLPEPVDFITGDLSFISLTKILPVCMPWLKVEGQLVVLIKPQFELGPHQTVKGVVRDPALRQLAVDKILTFCREELKLECKGIVPSAIKGPKGNQEYLAWFVKEIV